MELIYAEFSTIKSEIRFKAAVMRSSKQVGHGKISIHSQLKCKASALFAASPSHANVLLLTIICVIVRASGWLGGGVAERGKGFVMQMLFTLYWNAHTWLSCTRGSTIPSHIMMLQTANKLFISSLGGHPPSIVPC